MISNSLCIIQEILSTNDNALSVIERDGEWWFVADEVCEALGIGDAEMSNIVEPMWNLYNIERDGHVIQEFFLNDLGVLRLILSSQKPKAEYLKTWISLDIIPFLNEILPAFPLSCDLDKMFNSNNKVLNRFVREVKKTEDSSDHNGF